MLLSLLLSLFPACAQQADGSYHQISQEEAREMLRREDGHILLDVRRPEEYAEGHIPGAICLPNESIGSIRPSALPDPDQVILVYCRSGRRSKEAAQKLFDLGYTQVYEFGGILTWTGEIIKEENMEEKRCGAALSYESFDGGGPSYTLSIRDPELLECERSMQYHRISHEEMTGSGYTVTFTFTGLKPGETRVTVSARSPIAENFDETYRAVVDEDCGVTLTLLERQDPDVPKDTGALPELLIEVNGRRFHAVLVENSSGEAFREKLLEGPVTLEMEDYGGFEKVASLPWTLPANDARITAEPCDLILYQGDKLTIYYGENTWSFTLLGRIWDAKPEELREALGNGAATVTFSLDGEG